MELILELKRFEENKKEMKFKAQFVKSRKIVEVDAHNRQSAIAKVSRHETIACGFCPRFELITK